MVNEITWSKVHANHPQNLSTRQSGKSRREIEIEIEASLTSITGSRKGD